MNILGQRKADSDAKKKASLEAQLQRARKQAKDSKRGGQGKAVAAGTFFLQKGIKITLLNFFFKWKPNWNVLVNFKTSVILINRGELFGRTCGLGECTANHLCRALVVSYMLVFGCICVYFCFSNTLLGAKRAMFRGRLTRPRWANRSNSPSSLKIRGNFGLGSFRASPSHQSVGNLAQIARRNARLAPTRSRCISLSARERALSRRQHVSEYAVAHCGCRRQRRGQSECF